MATSTGFYKLIKPSQTDHVDVDSLNTNFDNIDNIMHQNELRSQRAVGNIAEEYDESKAYLEGDFVMHEGVLYKCITEIPEGEVWTNDHWKSTTVAAEILSTLQK